MSERYVVGLVRRREEFDGTLELCGQIPQLAVHTLITCLINVTSTFSKPLLHYPIHVVIRTQSLLLLVLTITLIMKQTALD